MSLPGGEGEEEGRGREPALPEKHTGLYAYSHCSGIVVKVVPKGKVLRQAGPWAGPGTSGHVQ